MVSPPEAQRLLRMGSSQSVRFGIKTSILVISKKVSETRYLKPGTAALGNPLAWGQRGRRGKIVQTLLCLPLYGRANGTQVLGLTGMHWQDLAPQPASPARCLPSAVLWGLQKDLGKAVLSMGDLLYLAVDGRPALQHSISTDQRLLLTTNAASFR